MDFTTMTVEELEARRVQIGVEVEQDGADLDALEAEIKGIKAELDARRANAAKQAEIRKTVAEGAGVVIDEIPQAPIPQEERTMFKRDSVEYRDAWTKHIIGRELNEEERAALTSDPVRVRPFSSHVNETRTGLSLTSFTASSAARASGTVMMVSITNMSTPASSIASACSWYIS